MINFGLAIDSATVLLRNDIMQCLYLKINMHASQFPPVDVLYYLHAHARQLFSQEQ